jgi:hypothetical protein
MTHFNSTEVLRFMYKHGCLISFEKAAPAGRLKRDFISLCTSDGRAVGLTAPVGFSTRATELPRDMFDDFMKASFIEQDRRPENPEGRIFFRLTADGRKAAAS